MTRPILEICVDDIAGVHAAIAGGADRIELCAALALGGLTPSAGLIEAALNVARPAGVAVHAMVRPRGGDFRYDDAETALAMREALTLIAQGVDGLVFGAARDGTLDEPALAAWVATARAGGRPVSLTLHRAIDVTADPVVAVDVAAALGFDRVLTSGAAASAEQGRATIARMAARAGDRIRIMAGAGIRPDNAGRLLAETGARELHASASTPMTESDARAVALGFDTPPRRRTDEDTVRALRAAIDQGVSS
ncbi:copper homeostasis protein CutC [Sphingomonas oryzagri]